MNEERDRFLTELMGQCWHDYDVDKPINTYSLEAFICKKCKGFILGNNDFSQEEDFAKLYKWSREQEKLKTILDSFNENDLYDRVKGTFYRERFADSIYDFFKQKR